VLKLTHFPEKQDGLDRIVLVLLVVNAQIRLGIVWIGIVAEHVVKLAIL
jgi:hypothetical protein